MRLRSALKRLIRSTGYIIRRMPKGDHIYETDGLISVHNHDFMHDHAFAKAYARGAKAAGDYDWHWRVHIGLWAADCASRLEGDFVECGVNRGFLSSAIMDYLDWDRTNKTFYLLDTFSGLDPRYISDKEAASGTVERNEKHLADGFYVRGVESARANFSEWENVRIIEGPVPDTLKDVGAQKIAFLHLDMNCAPPEVAAFNYFWDLLVPGAFVLLDDYAYDGYEEQKYAMDAAAAAKDQKIVSLPTGQGLLVKPGS